MEEHTAHAESDPRSFEIWEVHGSRPDDLWMLVHSEVDPDDWETFRAAVVHLENGIVRLELVLDTWAMAMWRSPQGDVHVGDMDGKMHRWSHGSWSTTPLGAPSAAEIWGLSDALVYCTAGKGRVFMLVDGQWRAHHGSPAPVTVATGETTPEDLYALGGTDADNLYTIGDRSVFHFNGVAWSEVDLPTDTPLTKLLAQSRRDVYFTGRHGTFLALHGARWTNHSIDDRNVHLRGIAEFRNQIFVGSHIGLLYHLGSDGLKPIADGIEASLRTIGDRLIAFGNRRVQVFDGQAWITRSFDFERIIPPASRW